MTLLSVKYTSSGRNGWEQIVIQSKHTFVCKTKVQDIGIQAMVPESNLSQTCKANKFLSHKHVIKEQINVITEYILLQKVFLVF